MRSMTVKSKILKTETISLDPDLLIAEGAYCQCYQHPENLDQCVKIPTENVKAQKRFNADFAYYRLLHRKETPMTHIADHLGRCETNLGPGHLYERAFDYDSQTSKTLKYYLEENREVIPDFTAQLIILRDFLITNLIIVNDLHGKNILVQRKTAEEARLVMVDGVGDCVFFTLPNLIPSIRLGKITRRWNRFICRLEVKYPDFKDDLLDAKINPAASRS